MRIVLIGQAAFGESVFTRLLAAGHEVVGVSAPAAPEGTRPDPLWAAAEHAGLPVLETRRLRRPEVFEQYAAWRPDLNVMAFVTDILRPSVLTTPRLGTIQYHPSLLPRHRGRSAMNWAIIQGERTTGLTIFWVDEGVDTGPILLQKEVAIGPDETMGSLYFEQLFPMGIEAMAEAVEQIRAGTAPRLPQDETRATYEPPCTEEQARIDWSAPAERTYDLIRGCNPQPGAVTTLNGAALKVFDVERVDGGANVAPGTVTEIDDGGVLVALGSGALRLKRVAPAGSGKAAAAEWARRNEIRTGARLGS